MSDSIHTRLGMLDEDRACIGCGYNLRGLSPESRCPECATPIAQSIRGNLLKHSDPQWLERLRFGTSLKLWNILVLILINVGSGFLAVFGLPRPIMLFAGFIAGVLALWASFAITTQEPRIALEEDAVSLRKMVRFCALITFMGSFPEHLRSGPEWGIFISALGGFLGLVGVVAVFGEFVYFRRFAYRIPDPKLARSTTVLMWAVSLTTVLATIMGFVANYIMSSATGTTTVSAGTAGSNGSAVTGQPRSAMAGVVWGTIGCGGAILFLVIFIWYVRLLTRYKNVFKEAAAEARSTDAPTASA